MITMTLGKAEIGVTTFCAASYSIEQCGANGLPLTPSSIRILGRFQRLKNITHPRLCQYLDLVREKHERVVVVSEHHSRNLSSAIKEGVYKDNPTELIRVAYQIFTGLAFLNRHGVVNRNISSTNVLFDSEGGIKLSKYGLYYMTDSGADVVFPIGKAQYMPPEVVCQGQMQASTMDQEYSAGWTESRQYNHPPSGPKVDVWSTAILLLEALQGSFLWSHLSLDLIFSKICSFVNSGAESALQLILDEHAMKEKFQNLPSDLRDLIRQCLEVNVTTRPTATDLLKHPVFKELSVEEVPYKNGYYMFSTNVRCADLDIPPFDESSINAEDEDHLSERSVEEVYYLWQLAGGDLMAVLRRSGLIRSCPPITKMARFSLVGGEYFGEPHDRSTLLDDTVITLSLDSLRQRLADVDPASYYPLLEDDNQSSGNNLPSSPSNVDLSDTSRLPLVIKERDVEYQFHRMILYDRLLKAYPYKRAHIWREARVDIPPLMRARVWAALLEVEGDVQGRYVAIDKETPTPTDRQIEVDVPRCHQYNELLSSPVAHNKFKRVLKAWVVSHPEYVYWQGLDSLCAPFLFLNFNDEALAYASLSAFIPKYLNKLFLKDNSKVIQEYLAVFSHLIAFHDAELSNHLEGIGFIPDLYAIPWFLTMFAHAFPLHKLFHLWDTLLLGNSSFPLCIGVAILQQLRDQLLSFGFNECILLFSDMPEIDIEACVQDSIKIFCLTPKSATYRQHARPPRQRTQDRPNVSYYSQDYHEQPHTELSMDPIPVEELKSTRCCRISAEDLLELAELMGPPSPSRSPTKRSSPSAKPKIIIIDTRANEDYIRGTLPGSINIPFHSAFGPDGELVQSAASQKLVNSRNLVKVVIGSRGKNAMNFAENLLRLGYSRVCVLHRGIDVLRPTGVLSIPI